MTINGVSLHAHADLQNDPTNINNSIPDSRMDFVNHSSIDLLLLDWTHYTSRCS